MRLPLILAVLALTACTSAPPGAAPGRASRIVAECRLLERAQAETRALGLTAWPDVLVGCPGHEGLGDAMTRAQMSDATRTANAAIAPAAVVALGPRADMVFRRMITRGVPEEVAVAMTATPEFAAAAR